MLRPSVKLEASLCANDFDTMRDSVAGCFSPLTTIGPVQVKNRPVAVDPRDNVPVLKMRAKVRHRLFWADTDERQRACWQEVIIPWLPNAMARSASALDRVEALRLQDEGSPLADMRFELTLEPYTFVLRRPREDEAHDIVEIVTRFREMLNGPLAEEAEEIARIEPLVTPEEADDATDRTDDEAEEKPMPDTDPSESAKGPSDGIDADEVASSEEIIGTDLEEDATSTPTRLPYALANQWRMTFHDGTECVFDTEEQRWMEETRGPGRQPTVDARATDDAIARRKRDETMRHPLRYGSTLVPAAGAMTDEESSADRCAHRLDSALEEKLDHLDAWLMEQPGAVIGFSGGAASLVLAWRAREILGPNATIVFGDSPFLPSSRRERAARWASKLDMRTLDHEGLAGRETRIGSPDRCYSCRYLLYEQLQRIAADEEGAIAAIGETVDVLHGCGRGHQALRESSLATPLADVGMDRNDIERIAESLGERGATRDDAPCALDRFPFGRPLDEGRVRALLDAEDALRARFGIPTLRLLVLDADTVRIDIDDDFLHEYLKVDPAHRIDYPELTRLANEWDPSMLPPNEARDGARRGSKDVAMIYAGEIFRAMADTVHDIGYAHVHVEDAIAQRVRERTG